MEILSARPRASTLGCGFVHDAAGQAEHDHAIVAQLPDPSRWIPRPTGLLRPVADHLGNGDAQADELVADDAGPWQFSIAFGDEELHGCEPLLPLRVVAIAHTDETVAAGHAAVRPLSATGQATRMGHAMYRSDTLGGTPIS